MPLYDDNDYDIDNDDNDNIVNNDNNDNDNNIINYMFVRSCVCLII